MTAGKHTTRGNWDIPGGEPIPAFPVTGVPDDFPRAEQIIAAARARVAAAQAEQDETARLRAAVDELRGLIEEMAGLIAHLAAYLPDCD